MDGENTRPMNIEQYKAKKLEELNELLKDLGRPGKVLNFSEFLSQTIDELGKLPKKYKMGKSLSGDIYNDGWNACIAEAERMRGLIK